MYDKKKDNPESPGIWPKKIPGFSKLLIARDAGSRHCNPQSQESLVNGTNV